MNLSRIGMVAVVGLGLGVLSVGCGRQEQQALGTERDAPTTPRDQANPGAQSGVDQSTPPSAQPSVPQGTNQGGAVSPASQIAQARCEQMQRCGKVGADQKHGDMISCTTAVQKDWREDLNGYACPGGFDSKELNECLSEIRTEGCDNPIEKLGSFVACRASDICENF